MYPLSALRFQHLCMHIPPMITQANATGIIAVYQDKPTAGKVKKWSIFKKTSQEDSSLSSRRKRRNDNKKDVCKLTFQQGWSPVRGRGLLIERSGKWVYKEGRKNWKTIEGENLKFDLFAHTWLFPTLAQSDYVLSVLIWWEQRHSKQEIKAPCGEGVQNS